MVSPEGPFVCRTGGADRVVPKVLIGVVPLGPRVPLHGLAGQAGRGFSSLIELEGARRALSGAAATVCEMPELTTQPGAALAGAGQSSAVQPGAAGAGAPQAPKAAGAREGTPGVDRPIEVIIADDHAVVRDGIRTVLERQAEEFHVVAEAADVPSTIREVRAHKPDLLTLDLTMPGGSSLAALPSCFVAHPTLAVAILTMREDPEYARQALRAGARSYVLKEAEPAELLQAFRLAVAGGNYLHPRLGAIMATGEQSEPGGASLSEREREVVRLIALGHTNPQIAEQLHVAERTVKTYRARAIEKLGFSSRAEITAYVRRLGLMD
jgi:two-component system response regulator NreC